MADMVNGMDINDFVKKQVNDPNANISDLLSIWRGLNNKRSGYDSSINQLAGNRLAQMAGVDPNTISAMGDQQIVQSIQGQGDQKKIADQATQQQQTINQFADQFSKSAQNYRSQLADTLAKNNQQAFQLENPFILEDLNSRGLFRSPTAVAQAQDQALKELEVNRTNTLSNFDTNAFGQEQDIRSGGLSNLIGGQQSALDAAIQGRQTGLQMDYNKMLSDNQTALANSLAKRQSRDQLYAALIGAGGKFGGAAAGGVMSNPALFA